MIQVYHNANFIDDSFKFYTDEGWTPDLEMNMEDFELVAVVDTTDLNLAYQFTNHITCSWWKNPGVEVVSDKYPDIRSTSMGDLLEMDGKFYVVAGCGFNEVK